MHVYENSKPYSEKGLPSTEYYLFQVIKHLTTKLDWTSSRRKSVEERIKLDTAKAQYKAFSKNPYFKEYRDELIKTIINHKAPNFGSFRLIIN